MKNIVLYCKSYRGDLDRTMVLADSVVKYNKDNIPFYISVPSQDIAIFKDRLSATAIIISDQEIFHDNVYEQGWITQQIVKSSFWKLKICQNYLMIDSDSYFIKPFYIKDFIVDGTEDAPYTVMHEQKDLFSWTCNKKQVLGFDPMEAFKDCREPIMNLFERKGRLYDFGPGPCIWSSKVWKSLEEKYLEPNNLTLATAIRNIKSEFTWYGEWLLTDKTIPIYPIEPIFKFFHYDQQYVESKNLGYEEQDYAKVYMGIVMQSNWGAPLKY